MGFTFNNMSMKYCTYLTSFI